MSASTWFHSTIRQIRERGSSNIVPTPYMPSLEFVDKLPPQKYNARYMCLFYGVGAPVGFVAFGGVDGANAVAEMELGKVLSTYGGRKVEVSSGTQRA